MTKTNDELITDQANEYQLRQCTMHDMNSRDQFYASFSKGAHFGKSLLEAENAELKRQNEILLSRQSQHESTVLETMAERDRYRAALEHIVNCSARDQRRICGYDEGLAAHLADVAERALAWKVE